jgi:hypothetical protein
VNDPYHPVSYPYHDVKALVKELSKFQNMKLKFRPNHGPSPMVVPPRYYNPKKALIERLYHLTEEKHTEVRLLRRGNREKEKLSSKGKKHGPGGRVTIEGLIISSREDIIKEVQKSEETTEVKKGKNDKRQRTTTPPTSESEEQNSENGVA